MGHLLQLHHVSKSYKRKNVINDLTLTIPPGKIIGLLGPNGSGKTTLIKLINGLIQPNKGEIVIDGFRPSIETKKIISYLPDTSYLREDMKIADIVELFAGFLIFGPIEGFIYNYIGIIIGSYLLFIIVKIYGRKFILLFVDEKTFYSYERKLETPGYEKLFILCMASPISPADIMVMITGLTNMSSKRFLSIIMIFKPISIIGYSYLFIFGEDLIRWFIK